MVIASLTVVPLARAFLPLPRRPWGDERAEGGVRGVSGRQAILACLPRVVERLRRSAGTQKREVLRVSCAVERHVYRASRRVGGDDHVGVESGRLLRREG